MSTEVIICPFCGKPTGAYLHDVPVYEMFASPDSQKMKRKYGCASCDETWTEAHTVPARVDLQTITLDQCQGDYFNRVQAKLTGESVHKVNGYLGIILACVERLERHARAVAKLTEWAAQDAQDKLTVDKYLRLIKQETGVSP